MEEKTTTQKGSVTCPRLHSPNSHLCLFDHTMLSFTIKKKKNAHNSISVHFLIPLRDLYCSQKIVLIGIEIIKAHESIVRPGACRSSIYVKDGKSRGERVELLLGRYRVYKKPSNYSHKFVFKLAHNSCKDRNYQFPTQLSFYHL